MSETLEGIRDAVRLGGVSDHAVALFREAVWEQYARAGRKMPWRETRDPYRILVSEVMLQQTRVERVRDKYAEFLSAFPDVGALAAAPLQDVLRVWKGLGYNRRAVRLRRAAQTVVGEHGGEVPREEAVLRALPGVGPATAAGVACFAYGEPAAYLETNVRSAMLYCFFPDRDGVTDAEVREVIERTLGDEDPREWYYAVMDLGAAIKKRYGNPSRRSAHHARQAPFEGSDRQVRGRILEVLLEAGLCSSRKIAVGAKTDEARTACLLEDLRAEGFLVEEGGRYRIA